MLQAFRDERIQYVRARIAWINLTSQVSVEGIALTCPRLATDTHRKVKLTFSDLRDREKRRE